VFQQEQRNHPQRSQSCSADIQTEKAEFSNYYRAMHFSAKRGIAIACRLSVCLSVCNVDGL